MSLPRLSLLAALAATAAILAPGGASACGCGEFRGVVVAHGSSLYGVPWRIKAILPRDAGPGRAMFEFTIGDPEESEGGYFTDLPRPIPRGLALTALRGSGFDDFPEADLSGIAAGRVALVRVEMEDGQTVEVEPARAPERLGDRFHWLRALRFYDAFFPDSQEPVRVTALDSNGQEVERLDFRHGAFR